MKSKLDNPPTIFSNISLALLSVANTPDVSGVLITISSLTLVKIRDFFFVLTLSINLILPISSPYRIYIKILLKTLKITEELLCDPKVFLCKPYRNLVKEKSMGKIVFKDTATSYKKNLQIIHTKEDIVINLPEPSGELISDLSIDRHIQNVEIGSDISKILKPNIRENNGGITSIENHIRPLDIASYRTSMFFVGKHTSTDWEAYADSEMRDLLDTGNSILNPDIKSSWLPTIEGDNRDVYVRYRFRSNSITSPWSDLLHYRTPSYGVRKFTITVSDNSLTPTISTSGFIPFGEDKIGKIEHRSTSWVIRDNKGRTVFESIDDTVNKTSIVVPDRKLFVSNTYTVNVIYNTNNIQYPSSNTITKCWKTQDGV